MYTAEEKRALALYNYEERLAREDKLMAEFKAMLMARGGEGGGGGGAGGASGAGAAAPPG